MMTFAITAGQIVDTHERVAPDDPGLAASKLDKYKVRKCYVGNSTIDTCINNATAKAKKEVTSIAECIRAASAVRGQAL
jgi:hypothetical protein